MRFLNALRPSFVRRVVGRPNSRMGLNPLRGFTLIEILVVMAIVATGLSVVSLSFEALYAREERREGQRLKNVLQMSIERAETRGQALALERLADGYRFLIQQTDGRWALLDEGAVWRARVFPKGLTWGRLSIEGQERLWPDPLELPPRARRFMLELKGEELIFVYEGKETGDVVYRTVMGTTTHP